MLDSNKLLQVVSSVFNVDVQELNDDSSPDTIENWDSMNHIRLIIALESEFNISLTPEDSMDMMSIRLIKLILQDKL